MKSRSQSQSQSQSQLARGSRKRKGHIRQMHDAPPDAFDKERRGLHRQIDELKKEHAALHHHIGELEADNEDMDTQLSLYSIGTSLLNDTSDEGLVSVLRSHAVECLRGEGPRSAKLSMVKDICEWDIGGQCNVEILQMLVNAPVRNITVQAIEGVCSHLLKLDEMGGKTVVI